jgi:large subunit ribosomal protein L9
MKVILKQEIKGVGKKGDIINVSDGYARNYLFPRELAAEAIEGNLASLKQKRDAEKYRKDQEVQEARELSKRLSGLIVRFKVKAGENGRLFGSITSKDISDEIKKQYSLEVDKKKLVLGDAIKSTGTYEIEVKVYPEISTKLKVEVTEQ